jgi:hypothetical protein
MAPTIRRWMSRRRWGHAVRQRTDARNALRIGLLNARPSAALSLQGMEFKDYYQTLGVTKAATADEIKKAFRKLARKHHPDISKAADATERMAELNEAVAVLSDPARRAAYDALSSGAHGRDDGDFQAPPWQTLSRLSSRAPFRGPDHATT